MLDKWPTKADSSQRSENMRIWSPFPTRKRDDPDQPSSETPANPQADKADRAEESTIQPAT